MRANFVCLSSMLVATWVIPCSGIDELSPSLGDVVCGPRCLQYLLQCYRKEDPGLIELVREVQWPDFEAGTSMGSLGEALRKRGLFTKALKIGPKARLCWPYPVLLHLNADDEDEGHFVVWLPSSTEAKDEVWSGLVGIRDGSPSQLARRRSGAILLTSPIPIDDPASALYDRDWRWHRAAQAATVLLAIAVFTFRGRLPLGRTHQSVVGVSQLRPMSE